MESISPQGYFNPRAPCGARPYCVRVLLFSYIFQPTRPLRGATPRNRPRAVKKLISTHAPLAGRDAAQPGEKRADRHISTHAPLAGRDEAPNQVLNLVLISTHAPLAGRDDRGGLRCKLRSYFNPRAPCGARRYPEIKQLGYGPRFQPTRPLRGATTQVLLDMMQRTIFQPTRPLRGATVPVTYYSENDDGISTHAPLAGRDEFKPVLTASMGHFNPRAPCGARQQLTIQVISIDRFQPTRPLRGATVDFLSHAPPSKFISTHAPLAGRDR